MQNTIWRESEGKKRKIFAHLVSSSNVSNVSRDPGDPGTVVSKGSSGYITSSAASSNSGAAGPGQKKSSKSLPGKKY